MWVEEKYNKYIHDEKALTHDLLQSNYFGKYSCQQPQDFSTFFHSFKSCLFKPCTDFGIFSHCQLFYLFQYDTQSHTCHGYIREPCSFHFYYLSLLDINQNYTGVTVVTLLSTHRLDRLQFHLDRWHEPLSIVIQMGEDDISTVATVVSNITRPNIRFTFYILKNIEKGQARCSYVRKSGEIVLTDSCFPINVLRDLGIETIQTTHYFILDGDAVISSMK